jgi:hypothetical protein
MFFHPTAERAARAVYGTIIALAVLVAYGGEDLDADPGEIAAAIAGAVVAAQLAELYAGYIGDVIRHERGLGWSEMRHRLEATVAGTLAALVPAVPFVLADAGAISLDTAIEVAPWLGLGTLLGFTLLANRLAGLRGVRSLMVCAGVLAIGLLLILLKAVAH